VYKTAQTTLFGRGTMASVRRQFESGQVIGSNAQLKMDGFFPAAHYPPEAPVGNSLKHAFHAGILQTEIVA